MVLPHRVVEESDLNEIKEMMERNFAGEIQHLNITLS